MTVELSPIKPSVSEVLVWIWALTLWLEELRQVCTRWLHYAFVMTNIGQKDTYASHITSSKLLDVQTVNFVLSCPVVVCQLRRTSVLEELKVKEICSHPGGMCCRVFL